MAWSGLIRDSCTLRADLREPLKGPDDERFGPCAALHYPKWGKSVAGRTQNEFAKRSGGNPIDAT